MIYTRIIGTGSYVPDRILTNADLEKMVDTSDQWIVERSGIKERHIVAENEVLSDMVEAAANKAIAAAEIDKNKIGLIIVATVTPEYVAPSMSCIVQYRLGLKNNCPAFDINAGCSGFVYGLNIANQYIKNGVAEYVLVVASEALSKVTNWKDRSTCVLFGDGAGAVVLKADNKPGIYATNIHADGNFNQTLTIPSSLYPFIGEPYLSMRGHELFKVAVTKMAESVQTILHENDMQIADIDWFIPHQANLRIIQAVAKKIKLPMEKAIVTIHKHGNTSAASIGLALDDAVQAGKIKEGDLVVMEVFGAGLTWGAVLVRI